MRKLTFDEPQPERQAQPEQVTPALDVTKVPGGAKTNPKSPFYVSKDLKELLAKKHEEVYEVNQDTKLYFRPQCLRGTSTVRLTESSPDWDHKWASLDAYLANEGDEEQRKADAKHALDTHTIKDATRKRLKEEYKFHQDNCSKQIKIREIFGPDSPYHPNQIVASQHLPLQGLCQQELLYKLACKISDMKDLQQLGFLAMDPYDFVRWRVNRTLAHQLPNIVAPGARFTAGIIRALGDPNVTKTGLRRVKVDAVFREAVILAAAHGGRLGSFKERSQEEKAATNLPSGRTWRKRRLRAELKFNARSQASIPAHFQSCAFKKRLAAEPGSGSYGGVNQWRVEKMQRK